MKELDNLISNTIYNIEINVPKYYEPEIINTIYTYSYEDDLRAPKSQNPGEDSPVSLTGNAALDASENII